jgi:ectoine hydroxylase-related dioxygenase (phytanoyl-CoA dioxygenase family)
MGVAAETDLPRLTTSVERARADLAAFGYCFLSGILSSGEVAALRTRLLQQAAAEEQAGLGIFDQGPDQKSLFTKEGRIDRAAALPGRGGVNQRILTLVNKGQVFRDIIINPVVLDMMRFWLGESFVLCNTSANIANPGGVPQSLHSDQFWFPRSKRRSEEHVRPGSIKRGEYYGDGEGETDPFVEPPVSLTAAVFLVDIDEEMGPTRFVPGTHRSGYRPHPDAPDPDSTVPAVGPAGTVCFFDARLFHGTGANRSNRPRLVILNHYCGPQIRQLENYTVALRPEIREAACPELLRVLGFSESLVGFGRVQEGTALEVLSGQRELIGEMTPAEG